MANLITSTISTLNGTVSAGPLDNFGTVGIIISGTWTGILTFEGSLDNSTFITILAQNLSSNLLVTNTTTNGQFIINTSGFQAVRVQMTSYTSGTANITIQANAAVFLQRSLSTLSGATDGTNIGNVGDRLKTDSQITNISGGLTLTTSKKLRYDDMNASSGGVARGTTVIVGAASINVYSYSGSGTVSGFLINLESSSSASDNWTINFLIDGEEIFNSSGLNSTDLQSTSVYNFNTAGSREASVLGIEMTDTVIYISTSPNFPIKYDSSVVIKVKKTTGSNRKFNAGLVLLTKET